MKKGAKKIEKDASLSVKLSSELLERVRRKSEETGVSISFKVRQCLEQWVLDKEK